MNTKKISDTDEKLLWKEAGRRLFMAAQKPTVPLDLVDRLHEQLPDRQEDETFAQFIRRASTESQAAHPKNVISPIGGNKPLQFSPLSEFERLAADSSGSEISLPDPTCTLESADGRFQLKIYATNDEKIKIILQALGFASDEFAYRKIAIANPLDDEHPIAIIDLDQDGDGECIVDDNNDTRSALLHPVLLLINED